MTGHKQSYAPTLKAKLRDSDATGKAISVLGGVALVGALTAGIGWPVFNGIMKHRNEVDMDQIRTAFTEQIKQANQYGLNEYPQRIVAEEAHYCQPGEMFVTKMIGGKLYFGKCANEEELRNLFFFLREQTPKR